MYVVRLVPQRTCWCSWLELMWLQLDCGQHHPELFWWDALSFSCLLVSMVRSVEEHVEGLDQRWSLPGGGGGQPNRRGVDRPPRKTKHAAPYPRSGVHGSVQESSLPYVNSTRLIQLWINKWLIPYLTREIWAFSPLALLLLRNATLACVNFEETDSLLNFCGASVLFQVYHGRTRWRRYEPRWLRGKSAGLWSPLWMRLHVRFLLSFPFLWDIFYYCILSRL